MGHFAGSIEEIDSGKELRFNSVAELLTFLSERCRVAFAQTGDEMTDPRTKGVVAKDGGESEQQ